MARQELFVFISLGFLIFEIIFIRSSFLFGRPIGVLTLMISFLLYSLVLIFLFTSLPNPRQRLQGYIGFFAFILCILSLAFLSFPLAKTYDTSWDGQGYHQTAVIALAQGWNPLRESSIHLIRKLPSQIFAEGYPSALWEIEASIYAVTGAINSAKVINLFIAIIASVMVYVLLRKLSLGVILSAIVSFLLVLQPIYVLQVLTFMQDGFGYELLLIALSSLIIVALSPKSFYSIGIFCLTELLLVSTKYSHLPVALLLGVIFILLVGNRFLNHEYRFTRTTKIALIGFLVISFIFASLPYLRNAVAHKALFYPTNITELMGSVRYNNVPLNLAEKDKFTLLFYGIFSKAQAQESGDPINKKNIAELKIPFMFSFEEVRDSATLYNNRVGAGGPLFSGLVTVTFAALFIVSFLIKTRKERYALYATYFSLFTILALALLAPTPNLLRYVNQLQILPFLIIVFIAALFKNIYSKLFIAFLVALISFNTCIYAAAVFERNLQETMIVNKQLNEMQNSGAVYHVRTQHFYSSYLLLTEHHIPFVAVDTLRCRDIKQLAASSTSTLFCVK